MIYSPAEREVMLAKMEVVARDFYGAAQATGCHSFIEFTGLMNEFIKTCRAAHQAGIDFNETNVHCGRALPLQPYNAQYLGEKLGCIYGTSLQEPANRAAFLHEIFPDDITAASDEPPTSESR